MRRVKVLKDKDYVSEFICSGPLQYHFPVSHGKDSICTTFILIREGNHAKGMFMAC